MLQEFAFYMDESGSPKPNPKDRFSYFAMGGVLIRREDEQKIRQLVLSFKQHWKINPDVPLHGSEIRSRKKRFAWLGTLPKDKQNCFFQDLTEMIGQCPILVHACVVSRPGYLDRYLSTYGADTWEMMKSSFSILLERVSKYVALQEGKTMIYFEQAGKKEDRLLTDYFNDLRATGNPFSPSTSNKYEPLSSDQFRQALAGIESKPKTNPILQVADLCLYPVARSKDESINRAFQSLKDKGQLIDAILPSEAVEKLGIKYYCFDSKL